VPDDDTDSIRIAGLDHIVLRTADPARLIAFYRDVLNCPIERETSEQTGLTQLRAGDSLIDIVEVDSELGRIGGRAPGREGRNLDHFCLRVADFDEHRIRRILARFNIVAGETRRRYGAKGSGPSIYIEDPDANVIELKGSPE
jgi:catechol 2,3-dioxygenase-like lactoylglutathione lyase family enzyme